MNEIVLKDDDLPEYLSTTLNEFISPLKIAYFTAADENLNFKCIFSNTPLYKKGDSLLSLLINSNSKSSPHQGNNS